MSQKEGLDQELKGLEELKISLSASKLNQMKDNVEFAITGFETKINEISQKLYQYEEINSCWKTDPIESDIEHLCSLSNVTNVESIYQSKSVPKWSILIGDKPSQLSSPTSLAIQQDTDNVFVSDKKGGRIQVYSSLGEHIRLIDKFNIPLNVIHVDKVFIVGMNTQNRRIVIELDLDSLNSRNINIPSEHPPHIITTRVISNKFVFFYSSDEIKTTPLQPASSWPNTSVYQTNPSVFAFNKPMSVTKYLGTRVHLFIDSKPTTDSLVSKPNPPSYLIPSTSLTHTDAACLLRPIGIATNGIHTYLLVSNSANLIYEFDSEDCKFIGSFCSSSLLSSPKCVCVDSRGNILVAGSEGDSTKLLCLSPDGDVIHELLLPYEECIGIAVNSKFDVAILCNGNTHGLISL